MAEGAGALGKLANMSGTEFWNSVVACANSLRVPPLRQNSVAAGKKMDPMRSSRTRGGKSICACAQCACASGAVQQSIRACTPRFQTARSFCPPAFSSCAAKVDMCQHIMKGKSTRSPQTLHSSAASSYRMECARTCTCANAAPLFKAGSSWVHRCRHVLQSTCKACCKKRGGAHARGRGACSPEHGNACGTCARPSYHAHMAPHARKHQQLCTHAFAEKVPGFLGRGEEPTFFFA